MESLRDYYKKQYEIESARRQVMTSAVAMPVAIISLVLGGLAVVARSVQLPLTGSAWLQVVCIAVAACLVLASAYYAARSFYGYEYGHIPTAGEIKSYYESLAAFYEITQSSANAKTVAEKETLEHLDNVTAELASLNSKNNDSKSFFLHRANGTGLLAVVALTIASGPYIVDSMFAPPTPQKTEVTNLKEVVMPIQRHANQPASDQKPVQTPAQTPPTTEKPSPPPGRLIKEDTDPNKKTR